MTRRPHRPPPLHTSHPLHAGTVACGTTCIDPLQQCCPATPSLGITCTSPLTCDGTTFTCKCSSGEWALCWWCWPQHTPRHSQPAAWLAFAGGRRHSADCACRPNQQLPACLPADKHCPGCLAHHPPAAGLVHCGNTCINTATQCCVSDFPLGQQCAAVDLCPSDGGTCGTGTCASKSRWRLGGWCRRRPMPAQSPAHHRACLPPLLASCSGHRTVRARVLQHRHPVLR